MPGSGAAPRCRGNRCHVPAVPRLGLRRDLPDGLLTAGLVSPDTPSQARPMPQIGQRPGQIRRSGGGVDRRLPHPPRHPPSRKAWSFLIDFRGGHRNLGFHDGLGDLREQPFDRALRRGDRGLARDHPCHARDCPACAGVDRRPMRAVPADPPGDRRSAPFASTSAPGRLRVPDTRSVGSGFRTTRGSPPGFWGTTSQCRRAHRPLGRHRPNVGFFAPPACANHFGTCGQDPDRSALAPSKCLRRASTP